MSNKIIKRISESQLKKIICESVKRVLNEETNFAPLDNGTFNDELSMEEYKQLYMMNQLACDECDDGLDRILDALCDEFDDEEQAIDAIFTAVSNDGSGICSKKQAKIARKLVEKLYEKYGADAFSYAYSQFDYNYSVYG